MIEAKELRIGNWVYALKSKPEPVKIDDDRFPIYATRDYSPIPLTPEILKKAGFIISEAVAEADIIELNRAPYYFELKTGNEKVVIKYLHQLQNSFFALTGQELEINMDEKPAPAEPLW
jgi:hypothetical protein